MFSVNAGVKPVTIELTDFKTKKVVETLEVDACMVATGRAPYTNGKAWDQQNTSASCTAETYSSVSKACSGYNLRWRQVLGGMQGACSLDSCKLCTACGLQLNTA